MAPLFSIERRAHMATLTRRDRPGFDWPDLWRAFSKAAARIDAGRV
jgi:hypothetical protein